MTDETRAGDPFPYPEGSVIGVFADGGAASAARDRLEAEGFEADRYEVLHGERDAARIDVTGEAHGRIGTIIRKVQDLATDEGEHVRRYAQHLRDGDYLIQVLVGDDEAAVRRAADALRGARPEVLTYYAADYIEDLGGTA